MHCVYIYYGGILLPLFSNYFSVKYVNMQNEYVDIQYSYVNMYHKYVDMQEHCNQIRIIKYQNYQISPTCDSNMQDATYVC